MSGHTPTPWELFNSNGVIAIKNPRSRSSHNEIVFWSGFDATHYPKQALANAAFIVKAVNNHEALVKALTDTLCELTACAQQLAARGLKGHEGDSVSRAQQSARDILRRVGQTREPS